MLTHKQTDRQTKSGKNIASLAEVINSFIDLLSSSSSSSATDDHAACTHRRFMQQYRINIGDDRQPTLALATDLYKFHRVDGFVSTSRRGSTTGEQLLFGRRGSLGPPMTPKSPKPNYRESFYRSSVFEPEESKPWERSPASGDMFTPSDDAASRSVGSKRRT